MLNKLFDSLVFSASEQPMVCVHRDYHSRNLLCCGEKLGIIDFQDALWGPVTYDAVSLLRDCYVIWPEEKVLAWLRHFYENSKTKHHSFDQWTRWFDWMGMQRHLKAIFIFARKFHRDRCENYLPDIGRALQYIARVSERYDEFKPFKNFLEQEVFVQGKL